MSATQPTVAEFARARGLIAVCRWTYAKTVPEAPHEYCLRAWLSPEGQAELDWFVRLIWQHGYDGLFLGQRWRYLDVDGHKYWTSMTTDRTGQIINRARLSEPDQLALEASR